MVRAACSSGRPAYGVGAGNATTVIDADADIKEAARNTRISKMSDFGSGCSADGNNLIASSIYDQFVKQLQEEGGYLTSPSEKSKLERVLWDDAGHRTSNTIAQSAATLAKIAGFDLPEGKLFLIVEQDKIGKQHHFSSEKLCPVVAVYKFDSFDQAIRMVENILEVGGKGHSCGVYSFNDEHIDKIARRLPVSRMMVRQPNSVANSGSFINGMPMTASMGCGVWGGNITNENVGVKHYMNVTWVSRPIAEDLPSEQELFGEFYIKD
jgi:sulfoacetaldehyde dehydrogenase